MKVLEKGMENVHGDGSTKGEPPPLQIASTIKSSTSVPNLLSFYEGQKICKLLLFFFKILNKIITGFEFSTHRVQTISTNANCIFQALDIFIFASPFFVEEINLSVRDIESTICPEMSYKLVHFRITNHPDACQRWLVPKLAFGTPQVSRGYGPTPSFLENLLICRVKVHLRKRKQDSECY